MKHNKIHPAALALLLALLFILTGCMGLTPQTRSTLAQVKQKTAIATANTNAKSATDLAKEKAAAALNHAKGTDSPIAHPINATNNLVVELRPWLIGIAVVSGLLWAIEFGLSFTPYKFLSFAAPIFRWVAVLSFAALIALPFLPAGIAIAGAAVICLLIYELVKDKGKVLDALHDSEDVFIEAVHPDPASPAPASPPAAK